MFYDLFRGCKDHEGAHFVHGGGLDWVAYSDPKSYKTSKKDKDL